jgi:hypothetical protein
MPTIKVLIAVQDDYQSCLPEVAANLQAAGMQVEQWLPEIGVITGSVDAEKLSLLSQIAGVDSIESDQEYQLAPPEQDLQ